MITVIAVLVAFSVILSAPLDPASRLQDLLSPVWTGVALVGVVGRPRRILSRRSCGLSLQWRIVHTCSRWE